MKQKRLLLLLALLMTAATGAWAQEPETTTYTVKMKAGTEDAANWTIASGENSVTGDAADGLTGLSEGDAVTLQYNGRLKVKGVKATSDAAAPSVPDGALSGVFSVSSTKQVYFSKGNLRYASSKWSFFDNQYDYYTGYSADAWDHFGWSTSATTYGMNTSTDNGDYSGDFVDWGATMGTGWFTLSKDEWTYLFKTRSASTVGGTENGRYAKAKVNNVPGIILFPDTYTHPDGVTAPVGVNATGDTGWNGNSYTVADWTKMESAGCVFLPAAGYREGSSVTSPGSYGYYWSATPSGTNNAYRVYSNSRNLNPENTANRRLGLSVRLVCEGATSDAAPAAQVDPLAVPMTIEAITAGAIKVSSPKEGMQYSLDGGKTKNAVTTDDIVLNVGDKVQFYGNGTSITSYDGTNITSSGDGFTCKVYGNIMSLVDETGFATATTLSANNTFYSLFFDFITLTDASGLLLPATQLAANCYRDMFYGCTALTAAPALPATQLANNCYQQMFKSCTALTAAPELPATQLSNNCYYRMFQGCASLTTAPALPATQLASSCYREMFSICARLTTAPVLPAETLVSNCYNQMFYNCSKLATVTCLATSGINQSGSTTRWLQSAGTQAEDTKTVYTISTADWPTMNNNGIPDGWQRVNVDN